MPSRLLRHKNYNLVDDKYDTRIPLHNEEAFQHGIHFKAKYIGTLDVPRPTGRMEIVVAMRKIRYEFKVKQIKKRKVDVTVSVDGVKITLRKKKKKAEWMYDEDKLVVAHDPVYRIFYVSHDSHDLKIWSYIARDGNSRKFRCNVFKSNKKSQAMRIVRTIGQAFEVCHKFNGTSQSKSPFNSRSVEASSEDKGNKKREQGTTESVRHEQDRGDVEETDIDAVDAEESAPVATPRLGVTDIDTVQTKQKKEPTSKEIFSSADGFLSVSQHEVKLLQQKATQAEQHAQVAVAQVNLLKNQLAAENTARIEAQARNHRLLVQNRELLSHVSQLIAQIKEMERLGSPRQASSTSRLSSNTHHLLQTSNPMILTDPQTPASIYLSSFDTVDIHKNLVSGDNLFENTNTNVTDFTSPTSLMSSEMQQHSYSAIDSASIVVNDHASKDKKNAKIPYSIAASFESANNSSSSSSSSDEDSDQETLSGEVHPRSSSRSPSSRTQALMSRIGKPDSLAFNDTSDTSVWTALDSPANTSNQLQTTLIDNSLYEVSSFLLSTTTQSLLQSSDSLTNGYSISPIPSIPGVSHTHSTTPSKSSSGKTVTNPVRWHRVSPSSCHTIQQQTNIPRLNPPPKVERHPDKTPLSPPSCKSSAVAPRSPPPAILSTSQQNTHSGNYITTSGSYNKRNEHCGDPGALQDAHSEEIPSTTQFNSTKRKLFEFNPGEYERQLRYEPLHKFQAAGWNDIPVQKNPSRVKQTGQPPENKPSTITKPQLTLPISSHDDADITVGSLLDEIDVTTAEAFSSEFWKDRGAENTKDDECLPSQLQGGTTSEDSDDPLALLEDLNNPDPSLMSTSSGSDEKAADNLPSNHQVVSSSTLPSNRSDSSSTRNVHCENSASSKTSSSQRLTANVDHLSSSCNSINDHTPVLKPILSPPTSRKNMGEEEVHASDQEQAGNDERLYLSSSDSGIASHAISSHALDINSSPLSSKLSEEDLEKVVNVPEDASSS